MTEHVVLTLVEVLHFAEIILSINLKRNLWFPFREQIRICLWIDTCIWQRFCMDT